MQSSTAKVAAACLYSGDKTKQFEEVYEQYKPMIFSKCLRMLRSELDAAEATQEVALKIFLNFGSFLDVEAKVAWLYRVSTNICLNLIRKKRHSGWLNWQALDLTLIAGTEPETVTQPIEIQEKLNKIPKRMRETFVYYFVDEMTQDEIAEVTGQSRTTVARYVGHIRQIWGKQ